MNLVKCGNEIIEKYKSGVSLNELANLYNTYPITISRFLTDHKVRLRHDKRYKGDIYTKKGLKLLEWAKSQDHFVTKQEMAEFIGVKRLSPDYFKKYPQLNKYIKPRVIPELESYYFKLYTWLNKNHIPYEPKNKALLGVTIDAVLLNDYRGLALQISEKPKHISKKRHRKSLDEKINKAYLAGLNLILINSNGFEHLDDLKITLNALKK